MDSQQQHTASSFPSSSWFSPPHQQQLRGILKRAPARLAVGDTPPSRSVSSTVVHVHRNYPSALHEWDFPSAPLISQVLSTLADGPFCPSMDYPGVVVEGKSDVMNMLGRRIFGPIEDALQFPMETAAQRTWCFRSKESPSCFPPPLPNRPRPANKAVTFPRCNADRFAIDSEAGILAVIEVKTIFFLSGMPQSKHELVQRYNTASGDVRSNGEDRRWMRAIAQLHGYLIEQECPYGILTCFNVFWFFKLDGTKLYVSEGISCDHRDTANNDTTMMEVLFAFLYMSLQDKITCVTTGRQRQWSEDHSPPSPILSSSSSDSNGDDSEYVDEEENQPKKRRKISQQDHPTTILSMFELEPSECLSASEDRIVLKGHYKNALVALKLYDEWKDVEDEEDQHGECQLEEKDTAAGRLRHEFDMYAALEDVQGSLIPRLLSRVSSGYNLSGFCMEWLEPVDWKEGGVKEKALTVVKELLERKGFLHDDLSHNNFAVHKAENRIVLIDLEVGHFSDDKKERKRYLRRAESTIMSF